MIEKISRNWSKCLIFLLVITFIFSPPSLAYEVDSSKEVHQYLAKEAEEIWEDMPDEIKAYIGNDYRTSRSVREGLSPLALVPKTENDYNVGDNLLDAILEEDDPQAWRASAHLWQPDNPQGGDYDDGLLLRTSSWRQADKYWRNYVVPYYLEGDLERSYYWLGRVMHLLQDATVPSHTHKDFHRPIHICCIFPDEYDLDDSFEEHSIFNIGHFDGNDYKGKEYDTQNLPNMANFNWNNIHQPFKGDKDLFRLFWYTAQKTQYYASDGVDGNNEYKDINNNPATFNPSLWTNEGATIINLRRDLYEDDKHNIGFNLTKVTEANLPHSIKAVAGLYKLFWYKVHTDWPFFHHDVERTGVTILPGDLRTNNIQDINIILDNADDFVSRIVIADTDGNGLQEAIVATGKTGVGGKVYSVERDGHDKTKIKWSYKGGIDYV